MAYSELIKNYEKIRGYLRDFYVYGFRGREDYAEKSGRSYDDERRRIESWMGEHADSRRDADGKKTFISIDSRISSHNPLYNSLKAKSFTDGDITLHFILLDILHSSDQLLSLKEITEKIYSEYLGAFDEPAFFDESTVRKKLREYTDEGLIKYEKRGKTSYYGRMDEIEETLSLLNTDQMDFFSEVAPCGVVGSFILDKLPKSEGKLTFKHHYITQAPDSDILCSLFLAISEKRAVILRNNPKRARHQTLSEVVPLRIYASVQNGRQYLLAYHPVSRQINTYRIDYIADVEIKDQCADFDALRLKLDSLQKHIWGVNVIFRNGKPRTEHVEFTVYAGRGEEHIIQRLQREKRCGEVKKISDDIWGFTADIFDTFEIIPWIRTFICRITSVSFSNKMLEKRLLDDIREMAYIYGLTEAPAREPVDNAADGEEDDHDLIQ